MDSDSMTLNQIIVPVCIAALGISLIIAAYKWKEDEEKERGEAMWREVNSKKYYDENVQ